MAKTVTSAFSQFLEDSVNLDKTKTANARKSRDWLLSKVIEFPATVEHFPKLFENNHIFFGSFARRTKKRPLDDIDMMICIYAGGASYEEGFLSIHMELPETNSNNALKKFCNPGTDTINSTKITNKFVSALKTVPQYRSAETKRNGEAATLKLTSYDWNFDIVPCFKTAPDSDNRTYYLIPDGNGNWKKTDPRIDRDRASRINQIHNGNVLNIVRLLKYWNKRPTMPSISSYLIETIILDYYEKKASPASNYIDLELPELFDYIGTIIFSHVSDPKGIQGNINHLSQEEKEKVSVRAFVDGAKSKAAWNLESEGKQESSLRKWGEIFGFEFPGYG